MVSLNFATLRVAVVHDWLPLYGGAERVLEQILKVFPDADLFSLLDFVPVADRAFLQNKKVHTSFIQKLPRLKQNYRSYLPLMPLAIEQFDLSAYDIIISSSYAVAKGVLTGPDQLHICYCHSPIRYGWDMQGQYLSQMNVGGMGKWLARVLLHYIRLWDLRTSHGVNEFIANSAFVARRIRKVYGRESNVIHPPVDTEAFTPLPQGEREDYYLTVSRLVGYKKTGMIIEAFAGMPDKKLVVIGDGPDFRKMQKMLPANVTLTGRQSNEVILDAMRRARALVFAAEEDFGIVPLEAQACGTPVIAFGKGGVTETILPGETGLFFYEQTAECLQDAVHEFESMKEGFCPTRCRQNAERFSIERFRNEFAAFVQSAWASFQAVPASANHIGALAGSANRLSSPAPESAGV